MIIRKKRMLKIIFSLLVICILLFAIYLLYKMNQLKKLETMMVPEMISYVTEEENTYVSLAIIDHGDITYHTYGQNGQELDSIELDSMELDSMDFEYEIGSLSKTMAALLVSRAIDENKINLSSPISDYLDLPPKDYYPTIERLLTHTSGYKSHYFDSAMIGNQFHQQNDFYGISKEHILEKAASISLEDKDYSFKYSNFGISVIGLVLEAVYQKDYTTLLEEFIKEELKLKHTTVAKCEGNFTGYWNWKADDGYIPAGAVISNISDMADYLLFYMTENRSYVNRTINKIKKIDANTEFYLKTGIRLDEIGLTWIHDTQNHIIWHNGGTSNYNSYIAMSEDLTKGVVILANYGPSKKIPVTVIGAKILQIQMPPA